MEEKEVTEEAATAPAQANIGQLAAALAKAQSQFDDLVKGATAKVGAYSYDYATLADCLAAVLPSLNANGIALMQPASAGQDQHGNAYVSVTTLLIHESGESASSTLLMPCSDSKPQAVGSAISYARRYSLCSMVGIAAGDDDGNEAQGNKAETKPTAKAEARRLQEHEDKRGKYLVRMLGFEGQMTRKVFESRDGALWIVDQASCDALQKDAPQKVADLTMPELEALGKFLALETVK
jgi:hypothetical protein